MPPNSGETFIVTFLLPLVSVLSEAAKGLCTSGRCHIPHPLFHYNINDFPGNIDFLHDISGKLSFYSLTACKKRVLL